MLSLAQESKSYKIAPVSEAHVIASDFTGIKTERGDVSFSSYSRR